MPVTQDQIDNFHRFALEKLRNGGIESLEECLRLWRVEMERHETVASVRRGEEDFTAGRCYTLDEVDAEIKRRLALR